MPPPPPNNSLPTYTVCAKCNHGWHASSCLINYQQGYSIMPPCPKCQEVSLQCYSCDQIFLKRRRYQMLKHIDTVHIVDEIQHNDSTHNMSVGNISFGDNNDYNDDDDNNDSDSSFFSFENNNNITVDMSLMSIDGRDNDDVGEVLDSDDKTWTNDMIDHDDKSDATTFTR